MKSTKRKHHRILLEAVVWAIAEIILSSNGLDILADYSEFLDSQKSSLGANYVATIGG